MHPDLEPLLQASFERAPAQDASAVLHAARERLGGPGVARAYEVAVPPQADGAWFCSQVVPKLVYHCDSLGIRPPEGHGIFLALFVQSDLYLVHARDAFALASRLMKLSPGELLERFGTGELRRAVRKTESERKPPALLGTGKPPGASA